MKKLLFIIGITFYLTGSGLYAQSPKWYSNLGRIKTMQSSRTDVERIFFAPEIIRSFTEDNIENVLYKTAEGELTVKYSTGVCSVSDIHGYNAKKNTLVRAIFFPNPKSKISDLKINKKQYVKRQDSHDLTWHYVSLQLGTDISFLQGLIVDVEIFPGSEYNGKKCLPDSVRK